KAGLNRGVPTIDLGADLLGTSALEAVVAHEIAHLALPHGKTPGPRWLARLSSTLRAIAVGAVLAVLGGLVGWWLCLAAAGAAVLAFAADLGRAYLMRRNEYEADAYAVRLLDATGRDGRALLRAALELEGIHETRWEVRAGWLRSDHPPATARLRRLHDEIDRTFPNDRTHGGTA
ncbi:M48 family metalloprotease, partial [Streptosporangium sandarakinum]